MIEGGPIEGGPIAPCPRCGKTMVGGVCYPCIPELATFFGIEKPLNISRRMSAWPADGKSPRELAREWIEMYIGVDEVFGRGREAYAVKDALQEQLLHAADLGRLDEEVLREEYEAATRHDSEQR